MKTETALKLLRGVSMLKFRPMDDIDLEYWADAEADAVISDDSSEFLANALTELITPPARIAPEAITVVVSGEQVELHGTDGNGEPFGILLRLGVDAF